MNIKESYICEVRVKKVEKLSSVAQSEVKEKLKAAPKGFNFKGYAKISYAETSPLRMVSVEPIEGTPIDFFMTISKDIPAR